ncbi:MAG: Holliday junction branch migration protein RuvA [bacterium]|nr:Holliday junction branch migration protein RuvA [bacterium]
MFDFLNGKIVQKEPSRLVLDVNGVGYALFIPLSTFDKLGDVGADCKILAWLYVREDQLTLFGFSTKEERDWFLQLIQLPGIGPKLALSILSGIRYTDFRNALLNADVKRLKSISGVGEKLAQRMIVELKNWVGDTSPTLPSSISSENAVIYRDVVMALEALGIPRINAEKYAAKVLQENPKITISEAVQKALSNG